MDWRIGSSVDHHPIGFSGHKNEYRSGVREGNHAEELLASDYRGRPGCVLDKGAFTGASTTKTAFTAEGKGKSGADLAAAARREDIRLKYVKYGTSQVMPTEKTSFFATTSQLAYGGPVAVASGGAVPKVQDCLWGASKFENRKVPVSMAAHTIGQERQRQLEAEAAASPYRTLEKDILAAAAQDQEARIAARPPMAQPRDKEGEGTAVGRKPTGQFNSLFDKDYLRIGLRKP